MSKTSNSNRIVCYSEVRKSTMKLIDAILDLDKDVLVKCVPVWKEQQNNARNDNEYYYLEKLIIIGDAVNFINNQNQKNKGYY